VFVQPEVWIHGTILSLNYQIRAPTSFAVLPPISKLKYIKISQRCKGFYTVKKPLQISDACTNAQHHSQDRQLIQHLDISPALVSKRDQNCQPWRDNQNHVIAILECGKQAPKLQNGYVGFREERGTLGSPSSTVLKEMYFWGIVNGRWPPHCFLYS
jgi:hypothetical protein